MTEVSSKYQNKDWERGKCRGNPIFLTYCLKKKNKTKEKGFGRRFERIACTDGQQIVSFIGKHIQPLTGLQDRVLYCARS